MTKDEAKAAAIEVLRHCAGCNGPYGRPANSDDVAAIILKHGGGESDFNRFCACPDCGGGDFYETRPDQVSSDDGLYRLTSEDIDNLHELRQQARERGRSTPPEPAVENINCPTCGRECQPGKCLVCDGVVFGSTLPECPWPEDWVSPFKVIISRLDDRWIVIDKHGWVVFRPSGSDAKAKIKAEFLCARLNEKAGK